MNTDGAKKPLARYCDVIVNRYMNVTGKRDIILVRGEKEIPVEDTGILD